MTTPPSDATLRPNVPGATPTLPIHWTGRSVLRLVFVTPATDAVAVVRVIDTLALPAGTDPVQMPAG